MPSLRLNIGLNNGRKLPFGGGAAPTEISVATTNTIIVTGDTIYSFNGTYTKQFASSYQSPSGNYLNFDFSLGSPQRWYLYDNDATYLESSPPAFNALFIPRAFTPSITLTAA
jgi:hypothetical protein